METLDDRRESLCLRFALKCTKNPTTKHMFAENKQKKIKTRQFEKYVVQFAHTERLRKSAIIYMQNQLNNYEKMKR